MGEEEEAGKKHSAWDEDAAMVDLEEEGDQEGDVMVGKSTGKRGLEYQLDMETQEENFGLRRNPPRSRRKVLPREVVDDEEDDGDEDDEEDDEEEEDDGDSGDDKNEGEVDTDADDLAQSEKAEMEHEGESGEGGLDNEADEAAPKVPEVARILARRDNSKDEQAECEYRVKYKGRAYIWAEWIAEKELHKWAELDKGLKQKIRNFERRREDMEAGILVPTAMVIDDSLSDGIRPEWCLIDRVVATRKPRSSQQTASVRQYLVKWVELPYDEATWEEEEALAGKVGEEEVRSAIERFEEVRNIARTLYESRQGGKAKDRSTKGSQKASLAHEHAEEAFEKWKVGEQPPSLVGGTLHDYQIDGVNWLRYSYRRKTNVVLADEMGLGKTIQTVAYVVSRVESIREAIRPPHLILVPLSTLKNWTREFSTWAPHLNVVEYIGNPTGRGIIREYDIFIRINSANGKSEKLPIADVVLTSYEGFMQDAMWFRSKMKWASLIVDEGHRLKNAQSKLFQLLQPINAGHRILLTGTPLQNNLDELLMLMSFVDPQKFGDGEALAERFSDLTQESSVADLHSMLSPHLLRRLKSDVLKGLPPKVEIIVPVELSKGQKKIYKDILAKNYNNLRRLSKASKGTVVSMTNIIMQLRKVCAHQFLIDGTTTDSPEYSFDKLISGSGKLELLDRLMPHFIEGKHRILIYSQFKIVLDLLEIWLMGRKIGYERIDGSQRATARQAAIDRFNTPNSTKQVFLLSTKAGGQGINLATADTVVIFDSDWNPHNDLQAMARAHRLGQKSGVMVFRLVSRASVEEKILNRAKEKMLLDHVVVQTLQQSATERSGLRQEELDDIMRHGAKDLFDESSEGQTKVARWDDASINKLLDRKQLEEAAKEQEEKEKAEAQNEDSRPAGFLASFNVAQYIEEEAKDENDAGAAAGKDGKENAEDEGADEFWSKLLKDRYDQLSAEEVQEKIRLQESLGKGKRVRRAVRYTEDGAYGDDDLGVKKRNGNGKKNTEKDKNWDPESEKDKSEHEEDHNVDDDAFVVLEDEKQPKQRQAAPDQRIHSANNSFPGFNSQRAPSQPPPTSHAGAILHIPPPKTLHLALSPPPKFAVDAQGEVFIYGLSLEERQIFLMLLEKFGVGDDLWKRAAQHERLKRHGDLGLRRYGTLLLKHLAEDHSGRPTFSDGVPREELSQSKVRSILLRVAVLHLIKKKVQGNRSPKPALFFAPSMANLVAETIPLEGRWTREADFQLLVAVIDHGYGSWQEIVQSPKFSRVLSQTNKQDPDPVKLQQWVQDRVEKIQKLLQVEYQHYIITQPITSFL